MSLDDLRLDSDRRLLQALLIVILVPVAWFAALDLMGIQPGTLPFGIRVITRVFSFAVPAAGLWLVTRARTRAAFSAATFGTSLAAVPVLVFLLLQLPPGSRLPIEQLLMILFVMYGALSNTFALQVLPPLALSAALVPLRLWWLDAPADPAAMVTDVVVLAFVNLTGVAMVRRRAALQDQVSHAWRMEHDAREAAERARRELKQLHGIIPICSNCKKVRSDAGEWQQIERYVHDHSDAQFSHGICPSCVKVLYPDYPQP